MRKFAELLSIIILLGIFNSNCANPSNPTGGPKDTIPPTLIETFPPNETTNFSSSQIELVFDEYIAADKLKTELLITPNYEGKYSHIVKKNRLLIEFEEPFDDSTTYTLNFSSAVTDITERNSAINLNYVFSTGDYLDSLSITGLVIDLLSQEPKKDIAVALYRNSDTLNPMNQKPRYYTTTNETGTYLLKNLKQDSYRIYAFDDDNRSLTLNTDKEAYAFKSDTIFLTQNIDSLILNMVSINASEFKIISARPFGNYFDIRTTKPVKSIDLTPLDSLPVYYILTNEDQTIRIYNHQEILETDSIGFALILGDTIKQTITDTLYAKFNKSRAKVVEFKSTIDTKKNMKVTDSLVTTIEFNKPIINYTLDSIYIQLDTLIKYYTTTNSFHWNTNRTSITFINKINWTFFNDTIKSQLRIINDSIAENMNIVRRAKLKIPRSTFISVENDSSTLIEKSIQQYDPSKFGLIRMSAQTDKTSFTIQLLNKKLNVIREIKNKTKHVFTGLDLGSYTLRVLVDSNNDGVWSPGNLLQNAEPEPVIYYNKFTEVRPNFEIVIEDLSF